MTATIVYSLRILDIFDEPIMNMYYFSLGLLSHVKNQLINIRPNRLVIGI